MDEDNTQSTDSDLKLINSEPSETVINATMQDEPESESKSMIDKKDDVNDVKDVSKDVGKGFLNIVLLVVYSLIYFGLGCLFALMDVSILLMQENCNLPDEKLVSICFIFFSLGHFTGTFIALPVFSIIKVKGKFLGLKFHGWVAIFMFFIGFVCFLIPLVPIVWLLYPLWFILGMCVFLISNAMTLLQVYAFKSQAGFVFQITGFINSLGKCAFTVAVTIIFQIETDPKKELFLTYELIALIFIPCIILILLLESPKSLEYVDEDSIEKPTEELQEQNEEKKEEEPAGEKKEKGSVFVKYTIAFLVIIAFFLTSSFQVSFARCFFVYAVQENVNETHPNDITYSLFEPQSITLLYSIANFIMTIAQLISICLITIFKPFLLLVFTYSGMLIAMLLVFIDAVIIPTDMVMMVAVVIFFFVSINSLYSAPFAYIPLSLGIDVNVIISTGIFALLSWNNTVPSIILIIADVLKIDTLLLILPFIVGLIGFIVFLLSYIIGKPYYMKYLKKEDPGKGESNLSKLWRKFKTGVNEVKKESWGMIFLISLVVLFILPTGLSQVLVIIGVAIIIIKFGTTKKEDEEFVKRYTRRVEAAMSVRLDAPIDNIRRISQGMGTGFEIKNI